MDGCDRAHILVADDDPDIRQLIADLLEFDGYAVTAVASGTQALEAVPRVRPDLALLDISMPGPDGYEVCRRLQADGPQAPAVIFVSAHGSTADRVAGLNVGAIDYIVKPFEPAELTARVRTALRQKAALDKAAAEAATDGLTGLLSRRVLDLRAAELIALARRSARPLACLMLDLDRFKLVNDTYGHAAGDEVLRQVAQRIRGVSRASDVVGRYGGDEFTILLPDTDGPGALAAAEKLRRLIAAEPVNVPPIAGGEVASAEVAGGEVTGGAGGQSIQVRASVGAATRGPAMVETRALYAAADGALYRAKQAGRDRVAVAET